MDTIKAFSKHSIATLIKKKREELHKEIFSRNSWGVEYYADKREKASLLSRTRLGEEFKINPSGISCYAKVDNSTRMVSFFVPYTGSATDEGIELVEYTPSDKKGKSELRSFEVGRKHLGYHGTRLVFVYEDFTNNAKEIRKTFENDFKVFSEQFSALAGEINAFNSELEEWIEKEVESKKAFDSEIKSYTNDLGYPVSTLI